MSDAEHVFPPRSGKDARLSHSGQRFISATNRKSGQSRSVQVVQLTRRTTHPIDESSRAVDGGRGIRAESWPDGFDPKPIPQTAVFDTPAPASKPAPQVGYLVVRSTSLLSAPPVPTETVTPPKPRGRPKKDRTFADPFGADDGANCIRCGYLVEPVRERRGKLTCAACGET